MMKYANPNWIMCRVARVSCWRKVGRRIPPLEAPATALLCREIATPDKTRVVKLGLPPCLGLFWASASPEEVTSLLGVSPSSSLLPDAVLILLRYLDWVLVTTYRSYSRPIRRTNSRNMTSRMTPMHEPANIPVEVILQVDEMKPGGGAVVSHEDGNIWKHLCFAPAKLPDKVWSKSIICSYRKTYMRW